MDLWVSSSPHVRAPQSTATIMRDVVIALLPAVIAGIVLFGFQALLLVCLSVAAAIVTEVAIQKLLKKSVTVNDWSAVVTGLLVAMNIPASAPWWLPVVGSAFAIAIVKQAFGGLGQNFMNPALAARAFLLASFPVRMTAWTPTQFMQGVDATTYATPLVNLASVQAGEAAATVDGAYIFDLFIGNTGGCIGEVCKAALLLGGIYLLMRRVITWRIPMIYMGTVLVFSFLMLPSEPLYAVAQVLSGGLFLGAFFMATDYTTSPVSTWGQVVYAVGCGVLTCVIRFFGGYPEGVSYSILLMNVAAPLIDKAFRPRRYGEVGRHA